MNTLKTSTWRGAMATKICFECRSEVDSLAKTCPHCRTKLGNASGGNVAKRPTHTAALGCAGCAGFFVFLIFINVFSGDGHRATSSTPQTPTSPPTSAINSSSPREKSTKPDIATPGNTQVLINRAFDIGDDRPTEAAKLFMEAAKQGNISGQMALGCCYDKGVGVPKNRREAIKWLSICVARGEAAKGDSDDAVFIRLIAAKAKERLTIMGAN